MMRRYRFSAESAKTIGKFGSKGAAVSPLMRGEETLHAAIMHIRADGILGGHPAACPQLFVVIGGSGWVRTGDEAPLPVQAGDAVRWETGEIHESGSETGMTALVLEGERLDGILLQMLTESGAGS